NYSWFFNKRYFFNGSDVEEGKRVNSHLVWNDSVKYRNIFLNVGTGPTSPGLPYAVQEQVPKFKMHIKNEDKLYWTCLVLQDEFHEYKILGKSIGLEKHVSYQVLHLPDPKGLELGTAVVYYYKNRPVNPRQTLRENNSFFQS
ncbi:hypothetical protein AVEN_200945-1, partial [Araneus ventricosus]